jgi:hypothetical protein
MSDIMTGTPANVTSPLVATVSSLSNNGSGAIRVQTSAPHLFGSGDTVSMAADPAFGDFTITVFDPTHFDLVGSTYTSTGTGTATDLSLTPQILVPTDGDTFSAQLSGLLSSQQAFLDRTQYLQGQVVAGGGRGHAAGASFLSTQNIASSTNTTPIQLTLSAPHGLLTGDTVEVWDHTVNSGANVTTTITRISATVLSLDGTLAGGVTGGATGHINPLVLIGSNADRIAALDVATGFLKLYTLFPNVTDTGANPTSEITFTNLANGSFVVPTGGALVAGWSVAHVTLGDMLEFDLHGSFSANGASVLGLALYASNIVAPGVGPAITTKIPGSAKWYGNINSSGFELFGHYEPIAPSAAKNGTVGIQLRGSDFTGGGAAGVTIGSDIVLNVRQWRRTGFPQ